MCRKVDSDDRANGSEAFLMPLPPLHPPIQAEQPTSERTCQKRFFYCHFLSSILPLLLIHMMWVGKYNAIPIIITNFLPLRSVPRIGIHLFTWGVGEKWSKRIHFLCFKWCFTHQCVHHWEKLCVIKEDIKKRVDCRLSYKFLLSAMRWWGCTVIASHLETFHR